MGKLLSKITASIGLLACLAMVGCGTSAPTSAKPNNSAPSASANAGEVLTRVEKTGTLTVGFEGTYPPFNYADGSNYAGFDVDISNEIARRLGVKTKFVATQWSSLIGGLQADKFDIIIAQMSITPERQKQVDFTDPYVVTGGVLVTRSDTNNIHSLDDLNGKKVGAGAGTTFEKVAKSAKGADVHLYKSLDQYVQDLMNHRLDAIINDQLVMGYMIKSKQLPLKIDSGLLDTDKIGMAIKKGNGDFEAKVNQALASMKSDGTYDKIFEKWFGTKPISE